MKPIYTAKDVGCYIDGARGLGDSMHRLSIIMLDAALITFPGIADFPTAELAEVYDILNTGNAEKLADDHSEFNDATEYLQSLTEEGLTWYWDDGLTLLPNDQLEP